MSRIPDTMGTDVVMGATWQIGPPGRAVHFDLESARSWMIECPSVPDLGVGEGVSDTAMSMFLLRSLLREVITDLSGPAARAGEPTGEPTMRYLIVVARNEPALYEHLRNRHGGDPRVQVLVDRRGASDVETMDGPPPVDRRRRRSWLATGASHELVEVAREDTAEPLSPKPQPSVRNEEAPRQMSEMETREDPQQVTRWLAESQHMLGRAIPALIEDRDRLRQTLDTREHECERLQEELGELRRDLGALQSDLDTLRGERVAIAEAFGGVVDVLGQLQGPLGEIARRLHAPRPVAVDTSAA